MEQDRSSETHDGCPAEPHRADAAIFRAPTNGGGDMVAGVSAQQRSRADRVAGPRGSATGRPASSRRHAACTVRQWRRLSSRYRHWCVRPPRRGRRGRPPNPRDATTAARPDRRRLWLALAGQPCAIRVRPLWSFSPSPQFGGGTSPVQGLVVRQDRTASKVGGWGAACPAAGRVGRQPDEVIAG